MNTDKKIGRRAAKTYGRPGSAYEKRVASKAARRAAKYDSARDEAICDDILLRNKIMRGFR
jgi:hypothetical protein